MSADRSLDAYPTRRSTSRSPELLWRQNGRRRGGRGRRHAAPRFVVQQSHTRTHAFDLRLEHRGVLVSWGVPKGLPLDGERSHLAIRVKDHPVESARSFGELATRRWGSGASRVWDSGTFETQKWSEHEIQVVLHGGVVEATFVLVHVDGDHWLVQRVAS